MGADSSNRTSHEPEEPRGRILVVLPYGMSLRNIVMNDALWGYLRRHFKIDLVTPVGINDPAALGVDRVIPPPGRLSVCRVARVLNARCLPRLRYMDYAEYFFQAREAETFEVNCRTYGRRLTARILFWSALGMMRGGRLLRAILGLPSRFHPAVPIRPDIYKFVLVGHNSEAECISYARAANHAGVPVICPVMGVDNIAAEPLVFRPDLLLLWGKEMLRDLTEFQVPVKPDLSATACAIVGSTIYDNYVRQQNTSREEFCREFGFDADDEVILFPAHVNAFLPNQTRIVETIVEFIRNHGLRVKVLVRVRPGFDVDMWEECAARCPHEVRVQNPAASSFDKSLQVAAFEPERERVEVERFIRTLRNITVTVNPSFSTMALDSMAFGKPAINAIYNGGDPTAIHGDLLWYDVVAEKTPAWRLMKVARNREELLDMLHEFFIEGRRAPFYSSEIVAYRALAVDGRSGERAAAAIEQYLQGQRGLLEISLPVSEPPREDRNVAV